MKLLECLTVFGNIILRKGDFMHSDFIVTTLAGLEDTLAQEIHSLGIVPSAKNVGVVYFNGTPKDCMRANLCLRTAEHVIMLLSEFDCAGTEELYEQVCAIDWKPWFIDHQTLSVGAVVRDSSITHPVNAALAVKDAISETLRQKTRQAPEVDRYNPDISVMLRLNRDHASIGIDTSGESLGHRRYSKAFSEITPEGTLAAGLVLASGWNSLDDLYIPFCGTGFLAVEAGLYARNIPPNIKRKKFGFMKLPWFDPASWDKAVDEACSRIVPEDCIIEVSDEDENALGISSEYAASSEVSGILRFIHRSFKDLPKARPASMLIASPPPRRHSTRTEITSLRTFYRTMGEVFRKRMRKSTVWVFTENGGLAKFIPLKSSDKINVYNGSQRCAYLRYDIR
jgi:putative N6-adenine-specific DNA methylase